MTVIVKAKHLCYGLPSAWDVWTEDGEHFRFKYRYGTAQVYVRATGGMLSLESAVRLGDRLGGITTLEEFCEATGFTLDLRTPYVPLPDPDEGIELVDDPAWSLRSVN
ncbi:hypothetical protein IU449_27135 [Nocardia higoensis]|uniref:Uncharacterized protein n=1 Tax=Nocardia higoensis TaxID=228599 RepID=A0ABS0DI84_9NOCA|nr:hypothetical protein [Nocardia higoensis]MBF6358176.1 hypothetical protein [Nocardia higoensis]